MNKSVLLSGLLAALLAALLALGGCHADPEPTPAPALPTIERPVLNLQPPRGGNVWIPQAALVDRGGIPGVFVLSDEGRARFRMVRAGRREPGRIEIISGLTGTETVVLGDLRAVRDGSPITPGRGA